MKVESKSVTSIIAAAMIVFAISCGDDAEDDGTDPVLNPIPTNPTDTDDEDPDFIDFNEEDESEESGYADSCPESMGKYAACAYEAVENGGCAKQNNSAANQTERLYKGILGRSVGASEIPSPKECYRYRKNNPGKECIACAYYRQNLAFGYDGFRWSAQQIARSPEYSEQRAVKSPEETLDDAYRYILDRTKKDPSTGHYWDQGGFDRYKYWAQEKRHPRHGRGDMSTVVDEMVTSAEFDY